MKQHFETDHFVKLRHVFKNSPITTQVFHLEKFKPELKLENDIY